MSRRPSNPVLRNPESYIQYHKGFTHDKAVYRVLAIDHMAPKEKELARAANKILSSGDEARAYVLQRQAAGDTSWAYTNLDNRGDVGVLRRQGIAVALFYKRDTFEYTPGPGEPLPEAPVEDPADAWQRLDIIGPSAKRANFFVKREVDSLREQNKLQGEQLDAKQMQIDSIETQLRKTEGELETRDKQLKDLRERMSEKRCVRCHADLVKKKNQAEEKIRKKKEARLAKIAAREEKERQQEEARIKAERLAKRRAKLNEKRIAAGLPPKKYGVPKKKKSKRGKVDAKKVTKKKKVHSHRTSGRRKVSKSSKGKVKAHKKGVNPVRKN